MQSEQLTRWLHLHHCFSPLRQNPPLQNQSILSFRSPQLYVNTMLVRTDASRQVAEAIHLPGQKKTHISAWACLHTFAQTGSRVSMLYSLIPEIFHASQEKSAREF